MSAQPAAAAHASGGAAVPNRKRLLEARALIVLASIIGVFAILSTWISSQVIDTNGWTETSVRMLENEKIRETIAAGMSERLLSVVDVGEVASEKLPPALAPLAPAISTAAAQVVPRAINEALKLPPVQVLWAQANRRAHARIMEVLGGGGKTLSTQGGEVTINLAVLLDKIGAQLGVGSDIGQKLPPQHRVILLMRSSQLRTAQNAIKGLRDLSFVLPALVALMYVGALAMAKGLRRRVILEIGIGILAAAFASLLLRSWVESYVVETLVKDEGLRPAIREVLAIATANWRDRSLFLLVTGALFCFAAWLAGPTHPAVKVREWIGGSLERHPGFWIAGVGAIVLVIGLQGPAKTPGSAIPLLIELVLAVIGVLALRRQVISERSASAVSATRSGRAPAAPTSARRARPGRGRAQLDRSDELFDVDCHGPDDQPVYDEQDHRPHGVGPDRQEVEHDPAEREKAGDHGARGMARDHEARAEDLHRPDDDRHPPPGVERRPQQPFANEVRLVVQGRDPPDHVERSGDDQVDGDKRRPAAFFARRDGGLRRAHVAIPPPSWLYAEIVCARRVRPRHPPRVGSNGRLRISRTAASGASSSSGEPPSFSARIASAGPGRDERPTGAARPRGGYARGE
jgi:hypothetical protein